MRGATRFVGLAVLESFRRPACVTSRRGCRPFADILCGLSIPVNLGDASRRMTESGRAVTGAFVRVALISLAHPTRQTHLQSSARCVRLLLRRPRLLEKRTS